jgi:hypothetical protein
VRSSFFTIAAAALAVALPVAVQAAPNTATPMHRQHVTQHTIAADLQKAGFTNVDVRAVAFVARATDKNGRPVLMAFRPNSFTAVTQLSDSGANAKSGTNNPQDNNNTTNK